MRWRWAWVGLAVALLVCLLRVHRDPDQLQDTDTRVLLIKIQERNAPFSWFVGDWPLENHFYRPISTLTFEVDHGLYKDQAWGYGLTNALWAFGCVAGLLWLECELAAVLGFMPLGWMVYLAWLTGQRSWCDLAATVYAAIVIGRSAIHRRVREAIGIALIATWLVAFSVGTVPLAVRVFEWPVGRTATVMTAFLFVALGAALHARRTGSGPAMVVSMLGFACALGSYEQAVVGPVLLAGIFWLLGNRRASRRPNTLLLAWADLLVAYVTARVLLVPSAPSGYQAQQFRHGPAAWLSLADYGFPIANAVPFVLTSYDLGFGMLLSPYLGRWVLLGSGQIATWLTMLRSQEQRLWIWAWLGSTLAFAPMAFLKQFEHYHVLPMGLQALMVGAATRVLWQKSGPR